MSFVYVKHPSSRFVLLLTLVLVIMLLSPQLDSTNENFRANAQQMNSANIPKTPIVEIPLKTDSQPLGITIGPNGAVWFAENNSTSIIEYNPANESFRSYSVPTKGPSMIWFMLFDPSGNLWFSNQLQPYLWRLSPTTGQFDNFSTGKQYVWPFGIVYDNFTNEIWFTSTYTDQIGYFKLNDEGATLGALINVTGTASLKTPPLYGPTGIQVGPTGNIFVSEPFSANIVEYNPTSKEFVNVWKLPTGAQPVGISIDSTQGTIWFANHASSLFGFVNTKTDSVTEYATSPYEFFGDTISLPYWVGLSTNGTVWIDEHASNKIARYDPVTGLLTEFAIPTNESAPLHFAIDNSKGIVWFTEFFGSNLGRVNMNASCECSVQLSSRNLTLSSHSISFYLKYIGPGNYTLVSNSPDPLITGTFQINGLLTENLTARFSVVNSTDYKITLMRGPDLMAGNYSITVCPRVTSFDSITSPGPIRECATALFSVTGSNSYFHVTPLFVGEIVVIAMISVAVLVTFRFHSGGKRVKRKSMEPMNRFQMLVSSAVVAFAISLEDIAGSFAVP